MEKLRITVSVLAVASLSVFADSANVEFSNSVRRYVAEDTVFTANTSKQAGFPSSVGTPLFWIDCSDTNGWTFTQSGGVLKVPSKVPGSDRYATSDKNDPNYENFTWKCFGYPNKYAVSDPVWVESPVFTSPEDGLAGCGVLDFGEQGSRRALVFNLWSPDSTCVASNVLANIGSVFAVYDSSNGGGFFLGGGTTGYGWHRGGTGDQRPYYNAVFHATHAFTRASEGEMRHNGIPSPPRYVGFAGGWETLAFCPAAGAGEINATSIGGGDMRSASIPANFYIYSGGMRIAEIILFEETLSEENTLKVEAYLRSKWMSRPAGWNGNAVLSALDSDSTTDATGANGMKVTVDAGAGETASVQTVSGGHFDSSFVKTGGGTLAFGAAPNFSTPLEVREGAVSFVRRPVPADVPTNYAFRLDAARTELITKDANNDVSRVDNFGGHQVAGYDLYLTAPFAKPKFVPDALGADKPILDLGQVSDSGAYLKFTTDQDPSADVKVQGVCSVVAVVGAQNGGGSLVASRSLRRGNPVDSFASPLLVESDAGPYFKAYVDGIRQDPAEGYPTPGYHVVAIQSPKSDSDGVIGIGARLAKTGCGGLRIAEVVVYDRLLSEEELKDASAYLMNKWFGRVPGDYQNPSVEPGSVELQKLVLSEGAAVDVPEGVAKVGRLDIKYPAVKTGKGTLKVQVSPGASSLLSVQEGSVVFEQAPDVAAADELAAGASFRLDASDASSLETELENGTNFVVRWYSPGWANLAYSVAGRRPWVSQTETLNGKPTVSFGDMGTRYVGNYMVFGRALHSIRSAYVVWRPRDAAAYLLGSSKTSRWLKRSCYDFVSSKGTLFRNNLFSDIYTNGVSVSRASLLTEAGEWVLVEAHSKEDDSGGLSASALCGERDNGGSGVSAYGGADYAEVILFERELSEREKVATRNYLLKKWLPSVAQSELPAAPAQQETSVSELEVVGEVAQEVPAGETVSVGRVVGDGALEKVGAGTLAARDLTGFTGTVDVQGGVLKLTGAAPVETEPSADGLVYHADATWGVTTETAASGDRKVVEWKSRLDDGWSAVPPIAWGDSKPRYLENALNGRPVVDLAVPVDTNMLQCLRFRKNGEYRLLEGLRTVVWVFGSQNGGGYLLGGGAANNSGTTGREWMRLAANQIPIRYTTLKDPIYYDGADKAARWGAWYLNGNDWTDANKYFSGEWDLITWDTKTSSRLATADGFGFDGQMLDGSAWSDGNSWRMTGQQRLAEVLFYDKTLSASEREKTENYLKAKWGLLGYRSSATNAASVVLADGAALDMDGKDQYLAALGGTGDVVNGSEAELTLGAISFDCSAGDCLSIAATVVVEEGFAVHFENFPAGGADIVWKIADVSGYDNRSGSSRILATGVPGNSKARLHYRDGGLYLEISKGYMLILR